MVVFFPFSFVTSHATVSLIFPYTADVDFVLFLTDTIPTKKAEGRIGWNVVIIAIKMRSTIRIFNVMILTLTFNTFSWDRDPKYVSLNKFKGIALERSILVSRILWVLILGGKELGIYCKNPSISWLLLCRGGGLEYAGSIPCRRVPPKSMTLNCIWECAVLLHCHYSLVTLI